MRSIWETKPLGDICDFARGLTYKKSDEVDHSQNAVLRANNISVGTGELNLAEIRYIRDDVVIPDKKMILRNSLIVCTASGSKSHLGKIALIDTDDKFAFGGFMGMLTPSTELLPKYLFWITRSDLYKNFIAGLSDGANINNLKWSQLSNLPIPLPPLPEQERIVSILDEAFAAIAIATTNAEKNLANARELFESQLVATFSNRSGDWETKLLPEVVVESCSLSYGIVQPGVSVPNGLPIVRPTDLKSRHIDLSGLKQIDPVLADSYMRTQLFGGELLLCVRGSTGALSVASDELAGSNVTRGIVPIRFEPKIINPIFGYYQFLSIYIQDQIKSGTYGAALMQINIRDIRKINILAPSLSIQAVISAELECLSKEIQSLELIYGRHAQLLTELKQSILHKAFTGELTADPASIDRALSEASV